jgi:SOS response regulatory protein OraA/RecX
MRKKCDSIETKLQEIGYNESLMLEIWMKSFVSLGKWEREIRMKLIKKQFPKQLVDTMMLQYEVEIHDWDEYSSSIEHQITASLSRGKSKQMILSGLLQKYPYFRHEIATILESKDHTTGFEKEITRYLLKYDISDLHQKQKLYAALIRKGFSYDEIKQSLKKQVIDS